MRTADDIESYLLKTGIPNEQIRPGMWALNFEGTETIIISLAGPVLVFRVKVMDVPKQDREAFYAALLALNTTDMVHGAYGVEGDSVVLVHALELENLDFNEFQAVIDDISLAIAKHFPALSRWRPAAPPAAAPA